VASIKVKPVPINGHPSPVRPFSLPPKWRFTNTPSSFVPRISRHIIQRSKLETRLDIASQTALTLIIAPAGFGKTTLIASWLRHSPRLAAWYSIDEWEADYDHFVYYLVSALRKSLSDVYPNFAAEADTLLMSNWRSAVSFLIEELSAVSVPTTLVLDDFHFVTDEIAHSFVSLLISRLPDNVNIIIASRTSPHLPLSRLRAQGLVRDIDADNLRFTPTECSEYLVNVMGLNLKPRDIDFLYNHTEGWIVGLQLAAIGLQDGATVDDLCSSKTGPLHHTAVYLLEEVLNRQPKRTRSFLIQSSVLDKMCDSLCNFVIGDDAAEGILSQLIAENLFVVPLDEDGRWFRYHHLFRSLLLEQLEATDSRSIPLLKSRACDWYEKEKMYPEATSLAVSIGNWERVVELIEPVAPLVLFQAKAFRDWLEGLPKEAFTDQPRLALYRGWSYLIAGSFKKAQRELNTLLQIIPASSQTFIHVILLRAILAYITLDSQNCLKFAEESVAAADDNPIWRYTAQGVLGSAYLAVWNSRKAEAILTEAVTNLVAAGGNYQDTAIKFGATIAGAQILSAKLNAATTTLANMENLAHEAAISFPPIGSINKSYTHLQRFELDLAEENLQIAHEAMHVTGVKLSTPYLWYITVYIYLSQGEHDLALEAAEELCAICKRNGNDGWLSLGEVSYQRVLLETGQLDSVKKWLDAHVIVDPTQIEYRYDQKHELAIRWVIKSTRNNSDREILLKTVELAEQSITAADKSGVLIEVAELKLLLSILCHRLGQREKALSAIDAAASILLPEGAIRPILCLGEDLKEILACNESVFVDYLHLKGVYELVCRPMEAADKSHSHSLNSLFSVSEREYEVLNHMAMGLTNNEIAECLYISLNTVKTHIKNLYFKLDAHSRTQAIAIARDSKLI